MAIPDILYQCCVSPKGSNPSHKSPAIKPPIYNSEQHACLKLNLQPYIINGMLSNRNERCSKPRTTIIRLIAVCHSDDIEHWLDDIIV